jgi:hypothetical protein
VLVVEELVAEVGGQHRVVAGEEGREAGRAWGE